MGPRQAAVFAEAQRSCSHCGKSRSRRGHHYIVYRTLFGKLRLQSPRFARCTCQEQTTGTFSPLPEFLQERTAPELLYLETKWAALMSYGMTTDLLADVLPLGEEVGTAAIRQNVKRIAERGEQELGKERFLFLDEGTGEPENLSDWKAPLAVGIDGGYIHARDRKSRQEGWFEVIVGKSIETEEKSKCFAFVQRFDTKPKRRLFAVLKAQGMKNNQQVTFLSDGGETVRNLPLNLHPQGEHVLDWFHVTMRLTVMGQMMQGMKESDGPKIVQSLKEELESLKWHLWNGNILPALKIVDGLQIRLDVDRMSEKRKRLLDAVRDFGNYISANQQYIVDYGDRDRNQERIATGFVESAVNQVVSKRMVKKQQMTWTEQGAHLLLQIRTRVINKDLRKDFCRWYPGLPMTEEKPMASAA